MTEAQSKLEIKAEELREKKRREDGIPPHVFPTKHTKKCNSWQARMRRKQRRLPPKARKLSRTAERR